MLVTNLKRIIRTGFYSFFRNSFVSLSSILVMVVTLLFIGAIIFSSAWLSHALAEIKERVDVAVSFVHTVEESEVLAVKESIEALPEVSEIIYTPGDQVYEDFLERHRDDPDTLFALEEAGENPFGSRLNIKAFDPAQYAGIAEFLDSLEQREPDLIYSTNYFQNEVAIENLTRIIDSTQTFGTALAAVLIIISILITFNTIRLAIYISKEEISVMKLVGASTSYIRGPFVVVGVIYGVVSGLIALAIFYPVTWWLQPQVPDPIVLNLFNYYLTNLWQISLILIVSGVFIGAVSSYLAVKKYLKT